MCLLSPEVLARVRFLPTDAYGMDWQELRLYLIETIQLGDRQFGEHLFTQFVANRPPVLGHNLGTRETGLLKIYD